MSDVVNKLICLCLNKSWQAIGYRTVKDTIIKLTSSSINTGKPEELVLDLGYEVDENNFPIMDSPTYINPVSWDEWITLPIRPWDLTIRSATREIRVPTVTIVNSCTKMPKRTYKGKPSREAIWKRDKGICQYTGRTLSKTEANVDHVVPRSRGGDDSWTNVVLSWKKINSTKGNKLNEELGLKLLKNPVAPEPVEMCRLITEAKHPDWNHFILKEK